MTKRNTCLWQGLAHYPAHRVAFAVVGSEGHGGEAGARGTPFRGGCAARLARGW